MVERNYSLREVKEIIDIAQRGKNLLRCKKFTKFEYDLLVQNLKSMEKYPEVFGKGDEDSRYGVLSMLEGSVREHVVTTSLPF